VSPLIHRDYYNNFVVLPIYVVSLCAYQDLLSTLVQYIKLEDLGSVYLSLKVQAFRHSRQLGFPTSLPPNLHKIYPQSLLVPIALATEMDLRKDDQPNLIPLVNVVDSKPFHSACSSSFYVLHVTAVQSILTGITI
jgi:hypothetical protein